MEVKGQVTEVKGPKSEVKGQIWVQIAPKPEQKGPTLVQKAPTSLQKGLKSVQFAPISVQKGPIFRFQSKFSEKNHPKAAYSNEIFTGRCVVPLDVIKNDTMDVIVNKVSESLLTTIDLEEYYPKGEIAVFDLKEYLFMGLILKEKDFRASLQSLDWEQYRDKYVAITCTADAIIPMWAYMLVASNLQPFAKEVVFGNEETLVNSIISKKLLAIKPEDFTDKRVVIKGCGDVKIPESAYVEITHKLRPFVKSIMYGEPCSTVPIYKKK